MPSKDKRAIIEGEEGKGRFLPPVIPPPPLPTKTKK